MSAATYAISFRQSVLPWADALADEARFKRIRNRVLIVCALLSLLFLLLPRPKEDRTQVAELPPQLAKIVLENEKPAPPPPPPAPVKVEKKEEAPANANPKKPEDTKPETVKAPVPEARDPKPNKAPGEEGIRRKAAGVIINPAGLSFTSVALLDALKMFEGPSIELHISNIHRREEIYHRSLISKAATAVIAGLGPSGYGVAVGAMRLLVGAA